MVSVKLILIVLALICFFIAAIGVPTSRVNLTPLGLFFWLLSAVVT